MAACNWYGPTDPSGERRAESAVPFVDGAAIPPRSILLVERNQLALRPGPRRTARVRQQHQRQQPGDLGFAGNNRYTARVSRIASFERSVAMHCGTAGARVSLVEHEIEHVQHGVEPRRALGGGRHPERHARRPDRGLRAADALRHRRFGDEERARDLRRRQPAHCAQRQPDRRRSRQCRMRAHEEQDRACRHPPRQRRYPRPA